MKLTSKAAIIVGAIALGSAAPALAQAATDPATGQPVVTQEEDDDKGMWGLAGLLGLA